MSANRHRVSLPVATHSDLSSPSSPSGACIDGDCGGFTERRIDRRAFLGNAGAIVAALTAAACGDGQIGNAATGLGSGGTVTVDPSAYAALASVGGIARISGTSRPIAVVRSTSTTYRAFSLICPHQGSTVNISNGAFLCPNHLARFDANGRWIGGQATGNLTELTVTPGTTGALTITY